MATPDIEMLGLLVGRLLRHGRCTRAERSEVLRIAMGLGSMESARIERVPVQVIRTRRKLIYRKLRLSGASELVSRLLAVALDLLAKGEGP